MNTKSYLKNFLSKDYIAETNEYIAELDRYKKKDIYLRVGLGVIYISLLALSLFVV